MASTIQLLPFVEGSNYEVVDSAQLPYEVLGVLGCGHTATVEKVQDRVTAAVFARKTLRYRGRNTNSEANKRLKAVFRNEVAIARRLTHHHVVKIYATYTTTREFVLILQPVADELDLERFLENVSDAQTSSPENLERGGFHSRLDSMLATLDMAFGCLATALAFIHRQRVRHKDIKPHNILIHHGRVYYSDFGYSLNCELLECNTTDGLPAPFTPKYCAPEVREHEKRNASSDVFSLGCVFLDILSVRLQRPHLSPDTRFFSDHLEDLREQLTLLDSALVPKSLIDLVRDMICPDQRYRPEAQEISEVLLLESSLSCNRCAAEDAPSEAVPEKTLSDSLKAPDFSTAAIAIAHDWIWSVEYRKYYRWVEYRDGTTACVWNTVPARTHEQEHVRLTEGSWTDSTMAPGASEEVQHSARGWYETLDTRYRMRTEAEVQTFFEIGRVFAMRLADAASETLARRACGTANSAITVGKFEKNVFSQIRRFVIVKVNRETRSVYALAITTHGGCGTTKAGCRASEHTIVHLEGTQPLAFQDEVHRGITKTAIMVHPTDSTEIMEPSARLRCGEIYRIEWSAMVRDIGTVVRPHKTMTMIRSPSRKKVRRQVQCRR